MRFHHADLRARKAAEQATQGHEETALSAPKAPPHMLVPASERNGHLKPEDDIRPRILLMNPATEGRLLRVPRGLTHALIAQEALVSQPSKSPPKVED
jgi:hypothetical protein